MSAVITEAEARRVTGGRIPLVPVEYENAVKSLVLCLTLDEAKYWDNKADALAAWAKIYRDDKVGLEAKRLKLHAYRRMGQLAHAIKIAARATPGRLPGAVAALVREGLSKPAANAASKIAKLPAADFQRIVDSPRPVSPLRVRKMLEPGSAGYKALQDEANGLFSFRSFCRRHPPATFFDLAPDEAVRACAAVGEIQDWLDELEQRLSKRAKP